MSSPILSSSDFKKEFDVLFLAELDRHIARAALFSKDTDCVALLAHVKDIALAGGKRIRPYVSYLAYRTAGGDSRELLASLVAFELFHTFALVHDDIIDRGSLRHGKPTLHEFARSYVHGAGEKAEHLAEGMALLVGDLMFNWSRETFLRSAPSAQIQALFDDMVYAVVLGQMLDVKIMCQENPTEDIIMEKTFLKTAEYTFIYPMRIGAAFAGTVGEKASWCTTLGTHLGIAFQIQDDLLDIVGDEHAAGKKLCKDVAEGQHTLFTAFVRAHGSETDVAELDSFFGTELDDTAAASLQKLFERTGALAYGKDRIAKDIEKARDVVATIESEEAARDAWSALITRMEKRSS